MLTYNIGETKIVFFGCRGRTAPHFFPFGVVTLVLLLLQDPVEQAAVLVTVAKPAILTEKDAVSPGLEHFQGVLIKGRGDQHFEEYLVDGFGRSLVYGHIAGQYPS